MCVFVCVCVCVCVYVEGGGLVASTICDICNITNICNGLEDNSKSLSLSIIYIYNIYIKKQIIYRYIHIYAL